MRLKHEEPSVRSMGKRMGGVPTRTRRGRSVVALLVAVAGISPGCGGGEDEEPQAGGTATPAAEESALLARTRRLSTQKPSGILPTRASRRRPGNGGSRSQTRGRRSRTQLAMSSRLAIRSRSPKKRSCSRLIPNARFRRVPRARGHMNGASKGARSRSPRSTTAAATARSCLPRSPWSGRNRAEPGRSRLRSRSRTPRD